MICKLVGWAVRWRIASRRTILQWWNFIEENLYLCNKVFRTWSLTHCFIRLYTNPRSRGFPFMKYRKIPKISPGAYIFQRPFLRGLFLEGLIFGGAYLRKEICVSKSIYHFCFVLLCIWGQFSKYKLPGSLYLERRFNGGFFALPD